MLVHTLLCFVRLVDDRQAQGQAFCRGVSLKDMLSDYRHFVRLQGNHGPSHALAHVNILFTSSTFSQGFNLHVYLQLYFSISNQHIAEEMYMTRHPLYNVALLIGAISKLDVIDCHIQSALFR